MATQFPANSINNRQGSNNPLNKLETAGYNVSSFTYPIDLTNDPGENHMIVFHINETNRTQYQTTDASGQLFYTENGQTVSRQAGTTGNGTGTSPRPTNIGLPGQSFWHPQAQPTVNNSDNISTFSKRPISRVATTIAMYIPPLVQTTYSTNWDQVNFGALGGMAKAFADSTGSIGANISQALGTAAVSTFKDLLDSGKEALSSKLGINGNAVSEGVEYAFRTTVNPNLEMLFRGIDFRTYQFDFKFTPRSQQEALNVANIVKAFKFYSAPEIIVDASSPKFLIYPAEFDIEFWSNGLPNDWINKISTCACTSVQVNYTGANMWSAFRPGTINGMGVETNMTLQFKEVEIITKNRILQGY